VPADIPADAAWYFWHEDPNGHTYVDAQAADHAALWLNTHPGDHSVWKYEARLRPADATWTLGRRWVGVSWSQLRGIPDGRRRSDRLRLAAAETREPALRSALLTRAEREDVGGERAGARAPA
jgi:hypothetical protein